MQHPDTAVCTAAMELARDHSPPFLFNHAVRTFAFGRAAGAVGGASAGAHYDEEVFFLGAVLHDLGLAERFVGADRFEVDGADAAAEFFSRRGYPDAKIAVVWDAIALHTTLSVPQRKPPEIALVHLGAGIDVGAIPRALVTPAAVEAILAEYPRLGFKRAFLNAMGAVVRRKPMTGVLNLMGDVGRAQEQLTIPSFCDVVMGAEFNE